MSSQTSVPLPARPSLTLLSDRAKALRDAQLVVAREHGGAVVVLQQEDGAPPARRSQGSSIFHPCGDALAIYRELRGRGVNASEPHVGNRMWCVGVSDPDG